jgi:hypothetical protein
VGWLHWNNFSWQHWTFFRLFALRSARVGTPVIVLSDSPCERIGKWRDFSYFERGQTVGACLAGISVTKTATLLRVSRAIVCEVMSTYTNHGKATWAKRNSGRTRVVTPKAIEHRLVPGNLILQRMIISRIRTGEPLLLVKFNGSCDVKGNCETTESIVILCAGRQVILVAVNCCVFKRCHEHITCHLEEWHAPKICHFLPRHVTLLFCWGDNVQFILFSAHNWNGKH